MKLAILPDFAEEKWPSMDLCAEMLLLHLRDPIQPFPLCPVYRRRWSRLPILGKRGLFINADRLWNRFRFYPRFIRRCVGAFDAFHVVDHSYSQLIHELPAERTGVYCHDLDTFRCLLQPEKEPRPRWFRKMMQHVLNGFRKAHVVFHSTKIIGDQIGQQGLIDPKRLVHAPYGVSMEFQAEKMIQHPELKQLMDGWPFFLHVGSCIPRKRIDVLLAIFAQVHQQNPDFRLLQIGGQWTAEQQEQIRQWKIEAAIRQIRGVDRCFIAAAYQQAQLVLLPSEAEGFGLPLIEAIACGANVVASDIPVLREVGGEAATFCKMGDVTAWIQAIDRLLLSPESAPAKALRLQQASRYTWKQHAQTIASAYQQLLNS